MKPKEQTLTYLGGKMITPDDFNEPPALLWAIRFSEPVKIQDVLKAVHDAGLPVTEAGRAVDKEWE